MAKTLLLTAVTSQWLNEGRHGGAVIACHMRAGARTRRLEHRLSRSADDTIIHFIHTLLRGIHNYNTTRDAVHSIPTRRGGNADSGTFTKARLTRELRQACP